MRRLTAKSCLHTMDITAEYLMHSRWADKGLGENIIIKFLHWTISNTISNTGSVWGSLCESLPLTSSRASGGRYHIILCLGSQSQRDTNQLSEAQTDGQVACDTFTAWVPSGQRRRGHLSVYVPGNKKLFPEFTVTTAFCMTVRGLMPHVEAYITQGTKWAPEDRLSIVKCWRGNQGNSNRKSHFKSNSILFILF